MNFALFENFRSFAIFLALMRQALSFRVRVSPPSATPLLCPYFEEHRVRLNSYLYFCETSFEYYRLAKL